MQQILVPLDGHLAALLVRVALQHHGTATRRHACTYEYDVQRNVST